MVGHLDVLDGLVGERRLNGDGTELALAARGVGARRVGAGRTFRGGWLFRRAAGQAEHGHADAGDGRAADERATGKLGNFVHGLLLLWYWVRPAHGEGTPDRMTRQTLPKGRTLAIGLGKIRGVTL